MTSISWAFYYLSVATVHGLYCNVERWSANGNVLEFSKVTHDSGGNSSNFLTPSSENVGSSDARDVGDKHFQLLKGGGSGAIVALLKTGHPMLTKEEKGKHRVAKSIDLSDADDMSEAWNAEAAANGSPVGDPVDDLVKKFTVPSHGWLVEICGLEREPESLALLPVSCVDGQKFCVMKHRVQTLQSGNVPVRVFMLLKHMPGGSVGENLERETMSDVGKTMIVNGLAKASFDILKARFKRKEDLNQAQSEALFFIQGGTYSKFLARTAEDFVVPALQHVHKALEDLCDTCDDGDNSANWYIDLLANLATEFETARDKVNGLVRTYNRMLFPSWTAPEVHTDANLGNILLTAEATEAVKVAIGKGHAMPEKTFLFIDNSVQKGRLAGPSKELLKTFFGFKHWILQGGDYGIATKVAFAPKAYAGNLSDTATVADIDENDDAGNITFKSLQHVGMGYQTRARIDMMRGLEKEFGSGLESEFRKELESPRASRGAAQTISQYEFYEVTLQAKFFAATQRISDAGYALRQFDTQSRPDSRKVHADKAKKVVDRMVVQFQLFEEEIGELEGKLEESRLTRETTKIGGERRARMLAELQLD